MKGIQVTGVRHPYTEVEETFDTEVRAYWSISGIILKVNGTVLQLTPEAATELAETLLVLVADIKAAFSAA